MGLCEVVLKKACQTRDSRVRRHRLAEGMIMGFTRPRPGRDGGTHYRALFTDVRGLSEPARVRGAQCLQ
jgi:hypothetical protein